MNWCYTINYVHFYFRITCIDQGKIWLHMESIEGQWSWLETKSKFSQHPTLGYHITSSPRKQRVQVQHVLEVDFGLQNCPKLWRSPRLHMDSDWDVLALFGKLIKSTFQWIKTHTHTISDWSAVKSFMLRPFSTNGAASPYFGPMTHVSCWVY